HLAVEEGGDVRGPVVRGDRDRGDVLADEFDPLAHGAGRDVDGREVHVREADQAENLPVRAERGRAQIRADLDRVAQLAVLGDLHDRSYATIHRPDRVYRRARGGWRGGRGGPARKAD